MLKLYECPQCASEWSDDEISPEHNEKEGCPDCLHECERCGELIDAHGVLEHCQ